MKTKVLSITVSVILCFAVGCGRKESSQDDKSKVVISMYERAIKINPQNDAAYNGLGMEYGSRGEYDKAIEAFKKAIEINPSESSYYDNLGVVYGNRGDLDLAIANHLKTLKMNPVSINALYNLGICYKDTGELLLAIETWKKAQKLSPDNYLYSYNLGVCYFEIKNYDKAKEEFQKTVENEATPSEIIAFSKTYLEKLALKEQSAK